jgi:hypothetical protein
MKLFSRIWDDVRHGENIELYLAIAAAFVLTIINLFGIDIGKWLSTVTVAVLGGLAVSNLVNRNHLVGLRAEVISLKEDLNSASKGQPTAAAFFHTRSDTPLPTQIRDARTLGMIGTSLISVAVTNQALIRNLKESGSRVRLLISDPDEVHLSQIYSARFQEAETPEQHTTNVKTSIANFQMLVGTSNSGGSVEVRMTKSDISFSYLGVNTGSTSGKISVEIYLNKLPLNENPMFTTDANTDAHWFGVFKNQFEMLWNRAKTIPPSSPRTS